MNILGIIFYRSSRAPLFFFIYGWFGGPGGKAWVLFFFRWLLFFFCFPCNKQKKLVRGWFFGVVMHGF